MNLEDKEKSLHDIFEFIWDRDSNTAAVPDKEHSIDTLWPVIQKLDFLTGGEVTRTLEFRIIPSPDASVTPKLVISVMGLTLPDIPLSNTHENRCMLSDMLTQGMDKKINSDGNIVPYVYKLKPEILRSLGDSVAVPPLALEKIGHGFNIAKAVEASRAFLKNVPELYKNISSPVGLIVLSGQHRQQIRALENLKSAQEMRADLNNTIEDS